MTPKKLIEVAMPVKEISAESVRDKSIRHGHISTLHLWWARRPLPVCRAVVFASLVPDPGDPNCPQAFKDAVEILLGKENNEGDPYKPYDNIPYTSVIDRMEDNLRNRLLMFIGKFSNAYCDAMINHKPLPPAKDLLHPASLIKWDNKNNETIINKARKLIWTAMESTPTSAHSINSGRGAKEILADFDLHYKAIKTAEQELYNLPDRHISNDIVKQKETALQYSIEAFLEKMPKVFDPFAGGGAIPLEAARLGCRSFGNDINPVAHIIQKGSLEFPQKFGKPIVYSKPEFLKLYGHAAWENLAADWKIVSKGAANAVRIPNRLSFDVEFYSRKLIVMAEAEIGHLYPADEKGNKPIAYYWARTATCSNPSCGATVPLMKQFYLCKKKDKKIFLKPIINGSAIDFEIESGICEYDGWVSRGNLVCPCCGNTTDVKKVKGQFLKGNSSERILAVIWEGREGKKYITPRKEDFGAMEFVPAIFDQPAEQMPVKYTQALPSCTWGLSTWGQMFSPRQLLAMQTIVAKMIEIKNQLKPESDEYAKAVVTYLGILVDRIAPVNNSFGRWDVTRENVQSPFAKQAIPMIFDFPESNPFCNSSGSASNQLDWLRRYIESESEIPFSSKLKNASSGEKEQFEPKFLTAVITDPPYYDAIAYADLSDFFYVWQKRTLGDIYPLNFSTPQTPKTEECTALKHHHSGILQNAKKHFENKLLQIFDAIEEQTSEVVSIMFAHQSTEAWAILCNSILGARMNITGSWAIDSEMANRSIGLAGAALESSVTVSCRPAQRVGLGNFKVVKDSVEKKVKEEVEVLYELGFRGPDLLTACFGKAVSVFGKYERVEKADGSEVTVSDLLEMARESAFNALLKGFDGDEFTKFYIGWLQLFGFTECDHDDVLRLVRVGLSIETRELDARHLLIKAGNKQTLAGFNERITINKNLGLDKGCNIIDAVHRGMHLFENSPRPELLKYITHVASSSDHPFWRVITSLCEVLPKGSEDHKMAIALNQSKDNLLRESKQSEKALGTQTTIDFRT